MESSEKAKKEMVWRLKFVSEAFVSPCTEHMKQAEKGLRN
jgi:hypothetical protein